jgi:hypothetical protein
MAMENVPAKMKINEGEKKPNAIIVRVWPATTG